MHKIFIYISVFSALLFSSCARHTTNAISVSDNAAAANAQSTNTPVIESIPTNRGKELNDNSVQQNHQVKE